MGGYETYEESCINHIIGVISNVTLGDFTVRAKHGKDDVFGALADGINMMIDQLDKSMKEKEKLISDLEKAKSELEQKVKERTAEMEQKVNELERFNKLSVGRELKMIELKKRIAELEGKK